MSQNKKTDFSCVHRHLILFSTLKNHWISWSLHHIANLCLIFSGTPKIFPKWQYCKIQDFTILLAVYEGSEDSTSLLNACWWHLCQFLSLKGESAWDSCPCVDCLLQFVDCVNSNSKSQMGELRYFSHSGENVLPRAHVDCTR